MKKWISAILIVLLVMTAFPCHEVYAWNQITHEQINMEVIDNFLAKSQNTAKFADSRINTDRQYTGTEVLSSSYFGCITGDVPKTFRDWVMHGGYSADEPEIPQSLRHFYDPLSAVGVTYLTDISAYYSDGLTSPLTSGIDARTWGLDHPGNPYSYFNALNYYKKSMEISAAPPKKGVTLPGEGTNGSSNTSNKEVELASGSLSSGIKILGEDKREGGTKTFTEKEPARDFYLAKSFRALGEAMHLLGDMTQPAHVRNDGHPVSEPFEDTMTAEIVMDKANGKLVSINLPDNPEKLFDSVATFTNRNFFSADTVYDELLKVEPWNGKSYYQYPELSKLPRIKGNIVFGNIDGIEVPLAEKTLSSYIYGVDEKESYTVPSTFTRAQATVLIPVAIKANEKLAEGFFPTMEFTMGYDVVSAEVQGMGTQKAYQLKAELRHLADQDPVWNKYGLKINYSGEARLIKVSGNKESILANVYFEEGALKGYRTDNSKAYEERLPVIVAGNIPPSDDYLSIGSEDQIYILIEAGGRTFKTKPITFTAYELSLTPKSFEGIVGDTLTIQGTLNKKLENMVVRWSFGDGTVDTTNALNKSYAYTKSGKYYVLVEVFDSKDAKVPAAKQYITASIRDKEEIKKDEGKPAEGPAPSPTPTPNKPDVPSTPKAPDPKPAPAPKEYDYKAALAAWMADVSARENKKSFDDGSCKTTCTFEWVVSPFIKDGNVYGASRLWYNDVYYAGPKAGTTAKYVASEMYDAGNPGVFMSLGDLRKAYPKF